MHSSLERIRSVFSGSRSTKKAQEYMRCWMQCRFGYMTKDKFYRDVRRSIKAKVGAKPDRQSGVEFVFDVATDVARHDDLELYRRISSKSPNPEFLNEFESTSKTTDSPRNLTVFLRELNGYHVTHTLVFALLSKYTHETDGRSKRKVARLVNRNLSRLASFVMRTALVSKFEPSHFEKLFADFASKIYNRKDVPDTDFLDFIKECDRKEHNVLNDTRFESVMKTATLRGGPKIKALLLGINRQGRPDAIILSDAMCSVEHIFPEGEEHWPGWMGFKDCDGNEWKHRIGNLTLLSRADNRPGSKFNGNFDNKISVYRESSIAITRQLSRHTSWSPDKIEKRQEKIAELAARVWSFS